MDEKTIVKQDEQTADVNSEKVAEKKSCPVKKHAKIYRSATYIAKIAMLCAAAVGLLYIEFPIFTATPWLELNVSDFPALLASFMFGPISGVIVNGVKVGLCLFVQNYSNNTNFKKHLKQTVEKLCAVRGFLFL